MGDRVMRVKCNLCNGDAVLERDVSRTDRIELLLIAAAANAGFLPDLCSLEAAVRPHPESPCTVSCELDALHPWSVYFAPDCALVEVILREATALPRKDNREELPGFLGIGGRKCTGFGTGEGDILRDSAAPSDERKNDKSIEHFTLRVKRASGEDEIEQIPLDSSVMETLESMAMPFWRLQVRDRLIDSTDRWRAHAKANSEIEATLLCPEVLCAVADAREVHGAAVNVSSSDMEAARMACSALYGAHPMQCVSRDVFSRGRGGSVGITCEGNELRYLVLQREQDGEYVVAFHTDDVDVLEAPEVTMLCEALHSFFRDRRCLDLARSQRRIVSTGNSLGAHVALAFTRHMRDAVGWSTCCVTFSAPPVPVWWVADSYDWLHSRTVLAQSGRDPRPAAIEFYYRLKWTLRADDASVNEYAEQLRHGKWGELHQAKESWGQPCTSQQCASKPVGVFRSSAPVHTTSVPQYDPPTALATEWDLNSPSLEALEAWYYMEETTIALGFLNGTAILKVEMITAEDPQRNTAVHAFPFSTRVDGEMKVGEGVRIKGLFNEVEVILQRSPDLLQSHSSQLDLLDPVQLYERSKALMAGLKRFIDAGGEGEWPELRKWHDVLESDTEELKVRSSIWGDTEEDRLQNRTRYVDGVALSYALGRASLRTFTGWGMMLLGSPLLVPICALSFTNMIKHDSILRAVGTFYPTYLDALRAVGTAWGVEYGCGQGVQSEMLYLEEQLMRKYCEDCGENGFHLGLHRLPSITRLRATQRSMTVVGITGASGCGKTTLVRKLVSNIVGEVNVHGIWKTHTVQMYPVPDMNGCVLMDTPGTTEANDEAQEVLSRAKILADIWIVLVNGVDKGIQRHDQVLIKEIARKGVPFLLCFTKADMVVVQREYRHQPARRILDEKLAHLDDPVKQIVSERQCASICCFEPADPTMELKRGIECDNRVREWISSQHVRKTSIAVGSSV